MKKPKGFLTFYHHECVVNALSDAQAGRLYKALFRYGTTGEEMSSSYDCTLNLAFALFKSEIDYNAEHYREVCENRSRAAKEREARRARETAEVAETEEAEEE